MESAQIIRTNMYPLVAVIVLNWNGWKDTIECLKSINNLDYLNYYFILVDNASQDDSLNKIRDFCSGKHVNNPRQDLSKFDWPIDMLEIDCDQLSYIKLDHNRYKNSNRLEKLIIIKNDKNYGFTEGNNIAMKFAVDKLALDYFLLLNNDTIVDQLFLKNMIKSVCEHTNIGFAGPKIYYYMPEEVSNIISFAGGKLGLNSSEPHPIGVDEVDNGQYNTDRIVDYVEGSCMLVSKDLTSEIGFFNPDYFTYWEEIDWCIRGKKAGYHTLYASKASIWHKCYGSDTGARSIYYMIRNRFLFIKENESKGQKFTSLIYYFCYFFWKIFFSLTILHRDKTKLRSFIRGTYDGIKILRTK
ncbi:glycosyltransferase family 2 protein [Methanobacterium sp. SMA-27]|uniref:glycosyltransferase family 2 protein n=1 Tax=Methanobacterium sp. SMA-27 TaxID=1495336 RepID=UPI0006933F6A|nr:glycosyltransferase family 2 protein [Methanobacterium sp. SMA-27]